MREQIKKCPLWLFIPIIPIIFLEKTVDFILNGESYVTRVDRFYITILLILANSLLFCVSALYLFS